METILISLLAAVIASSANVFALKSNIWKPKATSILIVSVVVCSLVAQVAINVFSLETIGDFFFLFLPLALAFTLGLTVAISKIVFRSNFSMIDFGKCLLSLKGVVYIVLLISPMLITTNRVYLGRHIGIHTAVAIGGFFFLVAWWGCIRFLEKLIDGQA